MNGRWFRTLRAERSIRVATLSAVIGFAVLATPHLAAAFGDNVYRYVRDWLAPAKQYAVVIGIDKYDKRKDLNYAVNDAETMARTLSLLGYIVEDDAILLQRRTDTQYHATREAITNLVSKVLRKAGPRDRVLVFYAGHGVELPLKSGRKRALLLPASYDPDNPVGTGLRFLDLVGLAALANVKAKQVLFVLDACYGAAALNVESFRDEHEGEISSDYFEELLTNPAYMVLTAGGEGEKVREKDGHGVFTRRLVHGLSGAADTDADGAIRFSELVSWLEPKVSDDAKPWKQNVGSGRFLPGIGQPVFVVPSEKKRNEIVRAVGLDGPTVTKSMRNNCRRIGKECPWLTAARSGGDEENPALTSGPRVGPGFEPREFELALRLKREERVLIQRGLNALVLDAGAEDGLIGEKTRAAIRRYQEGANALATGYLTADQAKALIGEGRREQAAIVSRMHSLSGLGWIGGSCER